MIFTSFEFVLFFVLVVIVRLALRSASADKWFLLAASCAFYLSWSIPCIFLILFTSLADFSIGRKMGETAAPEVRKRLLWLSLGINLGTLAFFKYSNFLLENVSTVLNAVGGHAATLHLNVTLPPAISFFTFASMSYVMDVYFERMPACGSARDYTLFITFFPKLLSGPIARAREFLPQLNERRRATAEDLEMGLAYFLIGAVKKLVIADQVASHVSLIFSAPGQYDGATLLMGLLGYTAQVYCDFSGYSDMAIGCARMMGFKLPENFQMPYSAASITEFWRRWHSTLSQWFRDYVFLPLELATRDNPHPNFRMARNMTATMLLCGLWHGPSWNFVIWGGIHGVGLATHKAWTTWNPLRGLKTRPAARWLWTICAHALTLGFIVFSMALFRSQTFSDAWVYLTRLFSWSSTGTRLSSPFLMGGVLAVIIVHLLVRKDRNLALELPRMRLVPRMIGYATLLVLLVLLGATDSSPFIYFQF